MPDAARPAPNIVLIGYRGSGKSAVGKLLAARLGRPVLDTDELIQQRAGCSIAEIFERQGEAHFRSLEDGVIEELRSTRGAVISVGGGGVERPRNRELLAEMGHVVWLTAPAEELHRRITADSASESSRPRLTEGDALSEVRGLLSRRTPWYEELAAARIDTTGRQPAEVAETILEQLPP